MAISRALRKYGLHCFEQKILLYADSLEELNYYEELLVENLKTRTPNGYNITVGGKSKKGLVHTPEAIEKIRAASTGRSHTDEIKAKISKTRIEKGFRHTPEVLARISEKRKGQMTGTDHPMFGKTHSDETKHKIGEAGLGRVHTDEAKHKIAEASKEMWQTRSRTVPFKERPKAKGRTVWNKGMTGFTHTEEAKKKISEAIKGRTISDATRQKMREAATLRELKKSQLNYN